MKDSATIASVLALGCVLAGCRTSESAPPPATPPLAPVREQAAVAQAPATTAGEPTAAPRLAPAEPAVQPANAGPRYLQPSWARQQQRTAGASAQQAEALHREGHALYKAKDDRAAVAKYEAALDLHATAQLYYDYANSLSNIERLPDSVQAYAIAVELGFAHPEIALYNSACAHSRMQDAEGAYRLLGQAVEQGYYAFRRVEQDRDLAFLRARADFPARLAELRQSPALLTGYVGVVDVRDDTVYTVCPSGKVLHVIPDGLDESCCGSTTRGELVRQRDALVIEWKERCGRRGKGGRESPDNEYEGCQPYNGCGEQTCAQLKERSELVKLSDIAKLAARRRSDEQDIDERYHTPFPKGVPAECQ